MKNLLLSLLAFCSVQSALATVVRITPPNNQVGSGGSLNVDMDADGTNEFAFSTFSGWPEWLAIRSVVSGSQVMANANNHCFSLNQNGLISANTNPTFWDTTGFLYIWNGASYPFVLEDTTYLGVRFLINGNIHYGYMKVLVTNYTLFQRMDLIELAYEDVPGWGIRMGASVSVGTVESGLDFEIGIAVSRGFLALDYGQDIQGNLLVLGANGQMIQTISVDGSHTNIPTSNLSAGIYLLRLSCVTRDGEAILTRKIFLAQ
jgi:hypothetical protein